MARATDRHLSLYEKIAEDHRRIGAEQEAARLAFEATSVKPDLHEEYYQHQGQVQYQGHEPQQYYEQHQYQQQQHY